MVTSRIILSPKRIAAAQAQKEILNAAEAAAFLGCSRKRLTLLIKRNEVPCRKLERRVFFSRKALERWVMGENDAPEKDLTTNNDAIMTTAANGETETKEGAEQ